MYETCALSSQLVRRQCGSLYCSIHPGRERPAASETALVRRAEVKSEVNYLALLTKGDTRSFIDITSECKLERMWENFGDQSECVLDGWQTACFVCFKSVYSTCKFPSLKCQQLTIRRGLQSEYGWIWCKINIKLYHQIPSSISFLEVAPLWILAPQSAKSVQCLIPTALPRS